MIPQQRLYWGLSLRVWWVLDSFDLEVEKINFRCRKGSVVMLSPVEINPALVSWQIAAQEGQVASLQLIIIKCEQLLLVRLMRHLRIL